MYKVVNGVERNLGLMDFGVDRLSSRLAIMVFDDFTLSKKNVRDINGQEIEVYVYGVRCTNSFNNKQVKIDVSYTTENKVALENALHKKEANIFEKVFIDFEDCVVGHYRSGSGDFANVAQTYKAEKVKVLSNEEVQAIMKRLESENSTVNIAEQIKQDKNHK